MKTKTETSKNTILRDYTPHIVILLICMMLALVSGIMLIHVRQMQENLNTLSGEVEVLQTYINELSEKYPDIVELPDTDPGT